VPAGDSTSLGLDETLILTPTAVGSDGSRTALTASMAYTSSNPFVATVSTIANARAQVNPVRSPAMPGMTTITGSYSGGGLCTCRTAPLTATGA